MKVLACHDIINLCPRDPKNVMMQISRKPKVAFFLSSMKTLDLIRLFN